MVPTPRPLKAFGDTIRKRSSPRNVFTSFSGFAGALPKRFDQESFAFYGTRLSGNALSYCLWMFLLEAPPLRGLLGEVEVAQMKSRHPGQRDEQLEVRLAELAHALDLSREIGAFIAGVALAFERPEEGEHEIRIEQGDATGRPSRITLFMSVENNALADVAIGGLVCPYGEGVLRL